MKFPYFHVDAFASAAFRGNPAGVCLLDAWLDDATLLNIAAENKHSETAFLVARGADYELRWFTPAVEMDLCGHATLAAAFVVFTHVDRQRSFLRFHSRSGELTVTRGGDVLTLDFPSRPGAPCDVAPELLSALGASPCEVLKSRDLLAVFVNEADVRALKPDFAAMRTLDCLGVIATAPGSDCDFVSRFFAPAGGVDEDPVTGSAHCTLIPYWAQRLGKSKMFARQISQRGGELFCELAGDRVRIGGQAVLYLRGEIEMENAAGSGQS
ncbi:MAG: PhzF family phenazine biosynthesis protein [Pedosphaera sp.]|nr:PhzF family phenazine biosynthesis protein [Pedosphaera sp.]